MTEEKKKFTVVGIVTSTEFQKCKFYVEKLCRAFSKEFSKPDIRPMLNVAWKEYLWKIRRKIGGKVWSLEKNAVVLLDNKWLGDDEAIFKYVTNRARVSVFVDFYCLGKRQLKEMIDSELDKKRKLAYFTISIDKKCVGSLLFLLYADLVPKTVNRFLRRCKSIKRGWLNRPAHRLVKGSWLQFGGFELEERKMPCENYVVPHDRRGVLSTCNYHKHVNNSTQLVLSLNPTSWMDYKFVAFGQLIHGDEVLKKMELVETYYESPKKEITVMACGEFTLDAEPDPVESSEVKSFLENINEFTSAPDDVVDDDDISSELSSSRYVSGLYCMDTDLEHHPALSPWHLVRFDIKYDLSTGEFFDEYYYERDNDMLKKFIEEEERPHQRLLSSVDITFTTEQMEAKIIEFDQIQQLDPTHVTSEVRKNIMLAKKMHSIADSSPTYKHIIE